jgi:hypothetical protein
VTEAAETPEQMEARLTKDLEARLEEELTKKITMKLQAAGGASAAVSVSLTLCC